MDNTKLSDELATAVRKLVKAKGRHHTEQNYIALAAALDAYDTASRATDAPAQGEQMPIELMGVAEEMAEGSGFWRSCSGCHESNEGHPTGPHSSVFGCALGNGCSECGGIGAVWDNTDYEAMGTEMAAEMVAATLAASADKPVAYVNGDELDNMLDDRTATIQMARSGWRSTPLFAAPVTASAVQAGAVPAEQQPSEQPKECWSADAEDYNALSLGELIDRNKHLKPGMTVHTGEAVTPDASDLYDGSDVIDQMADRAHDIAGEYAEGYPEVGPDEVAKLTGMIQDWITKNCPPRFYTVKNIKPYVLTEADFAAAPNNTEG